MNVFLSFAPDDAVKARELTSNIIPPDCSLEECDYIIAFISKTYIADSKAFVSELSYAACALHKPYILVLLEELSFLPPDLEMLAAKDGFTAPDKIPAALERIAAKEKAALPPVPTERRYAAKPFEASQKQFAFVSYAHDDAWQVYPVIKELYEAGWNLWYDEGIKISERYLPEIARCVRECEVFLLFVTECSMKRPFVTDFELAYALKLGKPIIPIILEMGVDVPESISQNCRAAPDATMFAALRETTLPSHGKRKAVSPKDKKGEDYDLNQLQPIKGYKYELRGKGLCLKKYTGKETEITVPASHCGLPVVELSGTFYKNKTITSVVCPETVILIGERTFGGCKKLKSVTYLAPYCDVGKRAYDYSVWWGDNWYEGRRENDGRSSDGEAQDSESYKLTNFIVGLIFCVMAALAVLALLAFKVILVQQMPAPSWLNWIPTMVYATLVITIKALLAVITLGIFIGLTFPLIMWSLAYLQMSIRYIRSRLGLEIQLYVPEVIEPHRLTGDIGKAKRISTFACVLYNGAADIREKMNSFRMDGYRLQDYTDGESIEMLVAVLTENFFQNEALTAALNKAINDEKLIVPVYWGMTADALPRQYAATVGQIQGLFAENAEFDYLFRRCLNEVGCRSEFIEDFRFIKKRGKITITQYFGSSKDIFIPSKAFEPPYPVTKMFLPSRKDSRLFIPETIKYIYNDIPFGALHSLVGEIIVHKDNPVYYSENGILYDRKKNCILNISANYEGPYDFNLQKRKSTNSSFRVGLAKHGSYFYKHKKLKTVTLPTKAKKIPRKYFYGCSSLSEIIIPPNIRKICGSAFEECTDLHYIYIPKAVKRISKTAFFNCPKLRIITPSGSAAWHYAEENGIMREHISESAERLWFHK